MRAAPKREQVVGLVTRAGGISLLGVGVGQSEELLMALGAFLWIVGELIAVRKGEDTTTSYVRRGKHLKRFGHLILVACIIGCGWLFGHFVFDWWG